MLYVTVSTLYHVIGLMFVEIDMKARNQPKSPPGKPEMQKLQQNDNLKKQARKKSRKQLLKKYSTGKLNSHQIKMK